MKTIWQSPIIATRSMLCHLDCESFGMAGTGGLARALWSMHVAATFEDCFMFGVMMLDFLLFAFH